MKPEIIDNYLETNINLSLKTYLNYLITYDYISKEDYEYLIKNTAIIIKQPSFFNKLWEKICGIKTNIFIVVEQKTLIDQPIDSNNPKKSEIIEFPNKK